MNGSVRVLQVLPQLISGGVERGTLEVAASLVNHGFKAYVCSAGGKLVTDLENLGAKHFLLPVHSKNPIIIVLNIFRLKNLIKNSQIDIVHARSRAPAISCYFACKLTNVKFITTFHGTYKISNSVKKLYNSVMLQGDKVIAISSFIYNHIVTNYRIDKEKLVVINRGVDLNYFSPSLVGEERIAHLKQELNLNSEILKDKKIILLPARFTRWKGHLYLLAILNKLRAENFLCLLVGAVGAGHDEYRDEIKHAVERYKLKDKVLIKEAVEDMPALYGISHFVISPSLEPEAFGRTIVEAQAMGKIIIATSQGGATEESIIDKVTGFHIPSNDINHAAHVLNKALMLSDDQYEAIAAKAMMKVREEYSTEIMCEKTLALYRSMLHR